MTLTLHKRQVHNYGVVQWWACRSLVRSFASRGRLQKVRAGCCTDGLYCITITWQQIFKGSLRVNGSRRFACMWLLNHGCNEVRWRPGQEASLAPLSWNLMSFGSKCTVLKNVFLTLLGLFGAPAVIRRSPQWCGTPIVIRRPGIVAPLPRPRYGPVLNANFLSANTERQWLLIAESHVHLYFVKRSMS